MKSQNTISKLDKLLNSQDYSKLLKEGREFIEKLSSDLWTDYNVHDPGITILEALCYAITELGYKTAYDITDLLVEKDGDPYKNIYQFFTARQILTNKPVNFYDFRKILIDIAGIRNAWLSIVENPKPDIWANCTKSTLMHKDEVALYPDDNTKEIKIRGLYDVLLELDEDELFGDLNELFAEVQIQKGNEDFTVVVDFPTWKYFFDKKIGDKDIQKMEITSITEVTRKRYDATLQVTLDTGTFDVQVAVYSSKKSTPARNLLINQVVMNMGAGSIVQVYIKKLKKALPIVEQAFKVLHANRNLCEDYDNFNNLEVERVSVCADIEVAPGADNEEVLANIYYQVEKFIAPHVNFYALDEMSERGYRTEEIFEGPGLEHGFIDTNELKASEPKTKILVSDIIQIIMDVEGVLAVKSIQLASRYKHEILNNKVEWCLNVKDGLVPRFESDKSKIILYKEGLPYLPVESEVEEFLEELYALERKQMLSKDELYDYKIPDGINLSVEDYYTIQNDFPLTYGIGSKGIPGLLTDQRIAQSKQLKAYLLFFDQLLANYLAQLSNVKALYSFSTKVDKTYFYKVLYNLPEGFVFPVDNKAYSVLFNNEQIPLIYHLLKDFTNRVDPTSHPTIDLDDYETFKTEWINYKKLSGFENPGNTHFVKNLDGIVEDIKIFQDRRNRFLDHLAARFAEQFSDYVLLMYNLDKKKAPDELIDDKTIFLQDYPVISSERGKAFNYKDEAAVWNTDNVAGLKKRVSRLLGIDSYNRKNLSCQPVNSYIKKYTDVAGEFRFTVRDNEEIIILRSEGYTTSQMRNKGIQSLKLNGKDPNRYFRKTSVDSRFYFNIKAANGEIIATSVLYQTRTARERAIDRSLSLFKGECNIEGFHLVEHLLLRPMDSTYHLMEVCVDGDCNSCYGEMDPYSFRITLLIPYWPKRFDNMAFRRFFEKTVRLETPAHIHPKICWADQEDIIKFEKKYRDWLTLKATKDPDPVALAQLTKELILILKDIRSVYPVATLHDCFEGADENIVILNQSILGTFNPDKDGID